MEWKDLKYILIKYIKILRANYLYVIWGIINFYIAFLILGANASVFFVCLLFSFISLKIALSPLGEEILRIINGVRSLETRREKDYLIPLFEEIYDEVKEEYPNLQHIEICIMDTLTVNALALGNHTIAVTRGAIETFTEDELKGIILHEFGHIIHGDTKAMLLNMIGNGIFSIGIIIVKIFLLFFDLAMLSFHKNSHGLTYVFIVLIRFILSLSLLAFTFTGSVILSINSRKNEYSADSFANEIGYGEDLINALYLLQKMSLGENMKLIEKMQSSHPHIAKRIGRLEALETDG